MPHRPPVLPALLMVGALTAALAGCTTITPPSTSPSGAVTTAPPPVSSSPSPSPGAGADGATGASDPTAAGAIAAVLLAESEVGGRAIQLDDEDDDANWEVVVAVGDREVEVLVSGDGSAVLSRDEDDDDLDDDDREGLAVATVGLEAALRAAVAGYTGDGRLEGAELTREGAGFAWEVEFAGDTEVYVSVTDGSVVRVDG